MTAMSIEERHGFIIATIAEIMEIDAEQIGGDTLLREDLGMDSLSSLELLSTLSRELKVDLEMEEAMAIRSVNDAARFVEQHVQARG